MRKGNLKGEKGRPIVSIGLLAMNCAKKAVPIEMQFAILSWVGSGTHVLFGGCILAPPGEYEQTARVQPWVKIL